jgi:prepilin-type N-terminal cleavage/methylation domain-containing protein/prepilin-type processing-associated H-X9-DG protein
MNIFLSKIVNRMSLSWRRRDGAGYGFSLVELLVVIAIMALLAALLMPAIKNMMAGAVQAECSNKMRLMGVGLVGYVTATGYYPPPNQNPPGYSGPPPPLGQAEAVTFAEAIYPYMFNQPGTPIDALAGSEFTCPGFLRGRDLQRGRTLLTYQWNSFPADLTHTPPESLNQGFHRAIRHSLVQAPANTLVIADARMSSWPYTHGNSVMMRDLSAFTYPPHKDKHNFLFCDGSVRLMIKEDTRGPAWGPRQLRGAWTLDPHD